MTLKNSISMINLIRLTGTHAMVCEQLANGSGPPKEKKFSPKAYRRSLEN